ncbi:MAG: PilZ domain-containing protein [Desulfobacula sp.]|nr:PilZ domain-containing protein [Desulfobacula sp.]
MIDKMLIIKKILETDEETDKKIIALLQLTDGDVKEKTIHIEERLDNRKDVFTEVNIHTGTEKISAETKNLSCSGVFIQTEVKIKKNEDIAVRLISPGGEEIAFVAKVVRMNGDGIGVMIKTISEKNSVNLTKYLDHL